MTQPVTTEVRELQYQLQACRNLEKQMLALGWPADAAHFRRRSLQTANKLEEIRTSSFAIRH